MRLQFEHDYHQYNQHSSENSIRQKILDYFSDVFILKTLACVILKGTYGVPGCNAVQLG
jgi:hypothetical protein